MFVEITCSTCKTPMLLCPTAWAIFGIKTMQNFLTVFEGVGVGVCNTGTFFTITITATIIFGRHDYSMGIKIAHIPQGITDISKCKY